METVAVRGGSWLFDEVADADVFTPERLTDEYRLIAKTTEECMASEVLDLMLTIEPPSDEVLRLLRAMDAERRYLR